MKLTMLIACLSVTVLACANWQPTRKAVLRRQAESMLDVCIVRCSDARACYRQNEEWCKSQGMEPSCGSDGEWSKMRTCTQ